MRPLRYLAPLLLTSLLLLVPLPPAAGQAANTRPVKGQLAVIVLPVEFTDFLHTESIQALNQTMAQVAQYYSAASFGKAVIRATVFSGWVLLSHPLAYYGADNAVGDDAAGNPSGSERLIVDAVSAARSSTDLSPFGFVVVVHAGADQATAAPIEKSPLIWSRTWIGRTFLPAGSDAGSIVSEFSPYGVWAHELGHQTGHLPDMYDLPDSSLHFMGTWSLMDIGAYLGQPLGNHPGLFDAWSRASLGWIAPTVVGSGDYNLIPAETPPSSSAQGCCYALEIQIDSASYYLVELRLREGIDSAQRTQGVLVYLYNASARQGQIRVVDVHVPTAPVRGDLSDAALKVGEAFSDIKHKIVISVTSSSSTGYAVHVSSQQTYSLSVILPVSVNVLTKQEFYVVLNPPIGGLKLQVFLDESTRSVASRNTTTQPRYNFTLYLPPGMQGLHNLTADLSDLAGKTLASSTVKFAAVVPLWLTLIQPTALYAYIALAVLVIFVIAVASSYRRRKRREEGPAQSTGVG